MALSPKKTAAAAVERATANWSLPEKVSPYVHGLHVQASPKTKGSSIGVSWHWMAPDNEVNVAQASWNRVFVPNIGPVVQVWLIASG